MVERKTGITYLKNLNSGVYYLYPVFYYNGEDNVASKHDHGEYIKITINPKYDLQLTNASLSKWQVAVGESFTLSATVKNKFDHLPHDVRVGLYINGGNYNNKLFYAKVFHPNDLGTKTFSTSILAPLTPGSYAITVKVDDENRTTETSEGNNQGIFHLMVLSLDTIAKMLPDNLKRQIFWLLNKNRLQNIKEEQEKKDALKLPIKLRRQIFWLLEKHRLNYNVY